MKGTHTDTRTHERKQTRGQEGQDPARFAHAYVRGSTTDINGLVISPKAGSFWKPAIPEAYRDASGERAAMGGLSPTARMNP